MEINGLCVSIKFTDKDGIIKHPALIVSPNGEKLYQIHPKREKKEGVETINSLFVDETEMIRHVDKLGYSVRCLEVTKPKGKSGVMLSKGARHKYELI